MSMNFSPEIEAEIHKRVESGRFSDASEVVGEAMRLLVARERLEQQRALLAGGQPDEYPIEFAPDVDREAPA